ncbi:MAG: pitrilysin family protein [Acidobacteriota bacterium]
MSGARVPRLSVERINLPNGVIGLLVENHTVPTVTIQAVVKTGERYVADEFAGLATVTGTLLKHGTTRRTANTIAEMVESVGGRLVARGGYAASLVELTLLSEDLPLGLELASELLRDSIFPEDRLQQVIDRRRGELQSHEDDPRWVASSSFNEIVFEGSPQHRPLEGYSATISRLRRDDVVAFHRQYFLPQNALVVVAGDFRASEVAQRMAAVFGDWDASAEVMFPDVTAPIMRSEPVRRVVTKNKEQVSILLGHLGISRADKDFFKIRVLDTILGDSPGFTSRIPRVLRDEQGLAYSVYCHMARSAGLDAGRFIAYIGTAPENLGSALDGLHEQIELITREPPTAAEVEAAKAYLTGSFVFEFETNSQLAEYLVNAEMFGLGFDYPSRFVSEIESVSVDDVFCAARSHIRPEALTEVIVGPACPVAEVMGAAETFGITGRNGKMQ